MKVIQKSCLVDLNYKNQTVDLGSPKRSEFNGVGSSAVSSERNFFVVLQCQEDNIPVQVTFEAAGNSPGVGMIAIADGSDAAKGVAVEVWTRTVIRSRFPGRLTITPLPKKR